MKYQARLTYPNLNLFCYDLRAAGDDGDRQQQQRFAQFLQRFHGHLSQKQWEHSQRLLAEQPFPCPLFAEKLADGAETQLRHWAQAPQKTPLAEILSQLEQPTPTDTSDASSNPEPIPPDTLARLKEQLTMDGYYYALALDLESYCLHINACPPYLQRRIGNYQAIAPEQLQTQKAQILQQLNPPPQTCDRPEETPPEAIVNTSLGRTWFLWAKQSDKTPAAIVATQCLQSLFPYVDTVLFQKECHLELWGGQLWEFSYSSNPQNPNYEAMVADTIHIIILLFPADHPQDVLELNKIIREQYINLYYLFSYRHRMNFAHWDSYHIKNALKQDYQTISQDLHHYRHLLKNLLNPRSSGIIASRELANLEIFLMKLFPFQAEYVFKLNQLAATHRKIDTDTEHYQRYLYKITRQHNLYPEQPLQEWILVAHSYQQQIRGDLDVFESLLQVIENTIKTIEGINHIEQTRGNRRLQSQITLAAIGVGGATTTAASVTTVTADLTGADQRPSGALINFSISLMISLLVGVVLMLLTHRFLLWQQRKSVVEDK